MRSCTPASVLPGRSLGASVRRPCGQPTCAQGSKRRKPTRDPRAQCTVDHPCGEKSKGDGEDRSVEQGKAQRPGAHVGRAERGSKTGVTMPVEDEPKGRHETKDDGQHDGKATEELEKDVEHGDHRANPSSIIGWLPFRVNET